MGYISIYDSAERNEISIIKNLFEQHKIKYRVLDEVTNDTLPLGVRVQVWEGQEDLARVILTENGFLGHREDKVERVTKTRFWIYLGLALLAVIVAAVLINWFMRPQ